MPVWKRWSSHGCIAHAEPFISSILPVALIPASAIHIGGLHTTKEGDTPYESPGIMACPDIVQSEETLVMTRELSTHRLGQLGCGGPHWNISLGTYLGHFSPCIAHVTCRF